MMNAPCLRTYGLRRSGVLNGACFRPFSGLTPRLDLKIGITADMVGMFRGLGSGNVSGGNSNFRPDIILAKKTILRRR